MCELRYGYYKSITRRFFYFYILIRVKINFFLMTKQYQIIQFNRANRKRTVILFASLFSYHIFRPIVAYHHHTRLLVIPDK